MTDTKHISVLRLLNATRLALTNHDTSVPTIAVNGRKLSHADIDLGTLLIADGTVKTKDAVDGQYYEVLNSNSKIDVRFEEEEGGQGAGRANHSRWRPALQTAVACALRVH